MAELFAGIRYYLGLAAIFGVIVGLKMLFGITLDDVDRWLDAHADWFELFGTVAFKGLLVFVLLMCLLLIGGELYARVAGKRRAPRGKGRSREAPRVERPLGFWGLILALIVAYFAYVGIFKN